ncbi:MAG: GTPase ObgE [Candidatus Dormibacteria bacterium]
MAPFLDEVTIHVRSGRGGAGSVSFRKEKFVPNGGPDGGDGGRGGDVFLVGTTGLNSLSHFQAKRSFAAMPGGAGSRNQRHGADAEPVRILVPVGTVVRDAVTEDPIGEVDGEGVEVLVVRGGKGGKGNAKFAGSRNQAPKYAELGEPAEERELHLELKLIADVGLVGAPNAGKSTLLAALTAATPKIADYPFTTLEPNLGVVEVEDGRRLVLADVPGLIEGASAGVGLGTAFLKHLSRTALLVYVLDCSAPLDEALETYRQVRTELNQYDPELAANVRVVALNKVDLPGAAATAAAAAAELEFEGVSCIAISARDGEGVRELMEEAFRAHARAMLVMERRPLLRVYRPEPVRDKLVISGRKGSYHVSGKGIENIVARTDLNNPEALQRMRRQLDGIGLTDSLLEAGAQPGDTVFVGGLEFVFDPHG